MLFLTNCFWDDQIKEDWLGGACDTWQEVERFIQGCDAES